MGKNAYPQKAFRLTATDKERIATIRKAMRLESDIAVIRLALEQLADSVQQGQERRKADSPVGRIG